MPMMAVTGAIMVLSTLPASSAALSFSLASFDFTDECALGTCWPTSDPTSPGHKPGGATRVIHRFIQPGGMSPGLPEQSVEAFVARKLTHVNSPSAVNDWPPSGSTSHRARPCPPRLPIRNRLLGADMGAFFGDRSPHEPHQDNHARRYRGQAPEYIEVGERQRLLVPELFKRLQGQLIRQRAIAGLSREEFPSLRKRLRDCRIERVQFFVEP